MAPSVSVLTRFECAIKFKKKVVVPPKETAHVK